MSFIGGYNGYGAAIDRLQTGTDYGQNTALPSGQASIGQNNQLTDALYTLNRDAYAQMLQMNAQNQQANLGFMDQMSSMFGAMMDRMMGMVEKLSESMRDLVSKSSAQTQSSPSSTSAAATEPASTSGASTTKSEDPDAEDTVELSLEELGELLSQSDRPDTEQLRLIDSIVAGLGRLADKGVDNAKEVINSLMKLFGL